MANATVIRNISQDPCNKFYIGSGIVIKETADSIIAREFVEKIT
jgi:hypothetical protein